MDNKVIKPNQINISSRFVSNSMITKKEETGYEKPKLFRIWNFLIYGSFFAIGAFLVYLYSAYIFINK